MSLRRFAGVAGIRRRLSVDRRALAAFRWALGTVVAIDILRRLPDITAFYTDQGVLPRSLLASLYPVWHQFSLATLSGTLVVQLVLFGSCVLAALSLSIGYRTRLATAGTLVLVVSIQVRNPLVLNAGDPLVRRLLFWGLLLPLGSRWAVDATTSEADAVFSPATVGLLAQTVAVYLTNLVFKLRGDRWLDGTAVAHVFQLDQFTVGLGDVLGGLGPLLRVAGWVWLGMLACSPLLVLTTRHRRTALVAGFISAHLMMFLTLDLGVFPLVSVVGLLPFLPSPVWDRVEATRPDGWPSLSVPSRVSLPDAAGPWLRRAGHVLATVALVAILVGNAISLGLVAPPPGTPDRIEDRAWDMFAPTPPRQRRGTRLRRTVRPETGSMRSVAAPSRSTACRRWPQRIPPTGGGSSSLAPTAGHDCGVRWPRISVPGGTEATSAGSRISVSSGFASRPTWTVPSQSSGPPSATISVGPDRKPQEPLVPPHEHGKVAPERASP